MKVIKIHALKTNYIWIIYNHKNECIIVDPGESKRILQIIKRLRLIVKAILVTHNHNDHLDGINSIVRLFPKIIIYGPTETQGKGVNTLIGEGDNITLLQKKFQIINLSGHTLGHIGYYKDPWLFCGDTVFTAGCGTFNKINAPQMYQSFLKIKNLPNNTSIFSGHEYTLSNIKFSIFTLLGDQEITNYYKKNCHPYIIRPLQTTPSTLAMELKINLFFQCDQKKIKNILNLSDQEEWKIFLKLREKKNIFNLKLKNKKNL